MYRDRHDRLLISACFKLGFGNSDPWRCAVTSTAMLIPDITSVKAVVSWLSSCKVDGHMPRWEPRLPSKAKNCSTIHGC